MWLYNQAIDLWTLKAFALINASLVRGRCSWLLFVYAKGKAIWQLQVAACCATCTSGLWKHFPLAPLQVRAWHTGSLAVACYTIYAPISAVVCPTYNAWGLNPPTPIIGVGGEVTYTNGTRPHTWGTNQLTIPLHIPPIFSCHAQYVTGRYGIWWYLPHLVYLGWMLEKRGGYTHSLLLC